MAAPPACTPPGTGYSPLWETAHALGETMLSPEVPLTLGWSHSGYPSVCGVNLRQGQTTSPRTSPFLAVHWFIYASLLGKELPFLERHSGYQRKCPRDSPGIGSGQTPSLAQWGPGGRQKETWASELPWPVRVQCSHGREIYDSPETVD